MPAAASSSVVPYVHAVYATDDGADDVVEVDPDVGLTPEDEEELVLEVNEPGGQNKKIIQTDRLIIQGQRYIRIFLEAEGKTVEVWTERVAQMADGRGWTSNQVQEELKRMLRQWKEQVCERCCVARVDTRAQPPPPSQHELVITHPVRQGYIRKDEEGKTKGKTYPINETNLRALRSGFQAEHAPPLRLARGVHSSPPP